MAVAQKARWALWRKAEKGEHKPNIRAGASPLTKPRFLAENPRRIVRACYWQIAVSGFH